MVRRFRFAILAILLKIPYNADRIASVGDDNIVCGRILEMGTILNPDNSAFQNAVISKIYIDKTGLLEYINSVMNTTEKIYLQQPSEKIWKVDYSRYVDGILQQRL